MADASSSADWPPDWPHTETTKDSWRHRRPIVLIAEDEPADQELIRRALRQLPERCDAHIVSDGEKLLEYLADAMRSGLPRPRPLPDLIILDLKMPRMDGRQTLTAITEDLKITTPVIIFSTSDDSRDVNDCYRAGCNSYVTKPIDLRRFNEVVRMMAAYWLKLSELPLLPSRGSKVALHGKTQGRTI